MKKLSDLIPSIYFNWEFSEEQGIGGFGGFLEHNPKLINTFSEAESKTFEEAENQSDSENTDEIVYFESDDELAEIYNELWGEMYFKSINDDYWCTEFDTEDEDSGVLFDGTNFYHYDLETEDGKKEYYKKKKEIEND